MISLVAVLLSAFFILYSIISLAGEFIYYSGCIGFLSIVVILLFSLSR